MDRLLAGSLAGLPGPASRAILLPSFLPLVQQQVAFGQKDSEEEDTGKAGTSGIDVCGSVASPHYTVIPC